METKTKKIKYLPLRLRRLILWIIGAVFFIGGILKLMDPVGAGLVMKEYFKFFHISFMNILSEPIAVTLALIETLIGSMLMTGILRKLAGNITLIFLSLFTFLTLLLLIFNPTMDCGCFGEAIHLTHLQTFLKNVVMLIFFLLAFYPIRSIGTPRKIKYISFGIVAVSTVFFMIFSLLKLPLIDFTDMKPGVMIANADNSWRNKDQEPEFEFIYEKDGIREHFTLENLPDSSWTFIESVMIEDKEQLNDNPAPYLSFTDMNGSYCDSLAAEGPVLAISLYNPDKASDKLWSKIYTTVTESQSKGFTPILLAAASYQDMVKIMERKDFKNYPGLEDITYLSDHKTMMTLNRSNGGATYINDGTIIKKWPRMSLPDKEELSELIKADETESLITSKTSDNLKFQGFLLYTFAIILLL